MFSKNAKPKKLRRILESPFQVFWPEKSKEELFPLQNALAELLPAARLEESNINPHMLEKREYKEKISIKKKQNNIYRNCLAPGYQSVIRGLEKKELCCAIFSNDVTPTLLLKVALSCAQTSSTPAVVIPDLKTITRCTLGFATMALGFKNVVAESTNPFHTIFNIVHKNPTIIEPLTTKPQENVFKMNKTDQGDTKQKLSKMYQVNTDIVYLFKKTNGKRAFVPNCKTEKLHEDNLTTEMPNCYDFISLGESTQGSTLPHSLKNQNDVNESYLCDYDDIESDEGNIFFVDNRPDKSLFKTKSRNISSENSLEEYRKCRDKKEVKKVRTNMQHLRQSGSQFVHNMSAHKISSSKHLKKLTKIKNLKTNKTLSNAVKFQPLSIKTITSNPNKTKVNNKKVQCKQK